MILRNDLDTQIRVQNMVRTMLELQDRMNTVVTVDWRNQKYPWYRAAWLEVAELIDHYGWKWWKRQEPAITQARVEVIDILHFCLSDYLQLYGSVDEVVPMLQQAAHSAYSSYTLTQPAAGVLEQAEDLAKRFLRLRHVPAQDLFALAAALDMSFDDLFIGYVGKNVLNIFRQDHGYKVGTYQKIWDGREDNEYLSDLMGQLDSASPDYADNLYQALKNIYNTLPTKVA